MRVEGRLVPKVGPNFPFWVFLPCFFSPRLSALSRLSAPALQYSPHLDLLTFYIFTWVHPSNFGSSNAFTLST